MSLSQIPLSKIPHGLPRITCSGADLNKLLPYLEMVAATRLCGRVPSVEVFPTDKEVLDDQNLADSTSHYPQRQAIPSVHPTPAAIRPSVRSARGNEAFKRFINWMSGDFAICALSFCALFAVMHWVMT